MTRRPPAPASLPPVLPGLDPAWSRLVTAVDTTGVARTWHVLDNGVAPAVATMLCVHGNPTWSYLWRRFLAEAPPGWRVLAVDQLGMGHSERITEPRPLAQRVADLGTLTAALGVAGQVVTVGHDWGGPISLGWALEHRDQLRAVVLANTAVHQPAEALAPTLIRLARSPVLRPAVCAATPAFVRAAGALSRPALAREVRDALAEPYRTADRRRAVDDFVADIPLDPGHPSRGPLDGIAAGLTGLAGVPVLALWGPRDPVFSDRYLRDLLARLPHAQVHRYERASHLVVEDAPETAAHAWQWVVSNTGESVATNGFHPPPAAPEERTSGPVKPHGLHQPSAAPSERTNNPVEPHEIHPPSAAPHERTDNPVEPHGIHPPSAAPHERTDNPVEPHGIHPPSAAPHERTNNPVEPHGIHPPSTAPHERADNPVEPIGYRPLWAALDERAGDPAPAVVELAGRTVSFGRLQRRVRELAAGLAAVGVAPGDRVALLIPPGADLTAAVYGCWLAGAAIVVADAGLGAAGLARALRGAAPDHVIGVPAGLVLARAFGVPGRRIAAGPAGPAVRRLLGAPHGLAELARLGRDRQPPAEPAAGAEAAVVFTSGATGPPKGVVYRHHQLQAQLDILRTAFGITAEDRLVAAFPPFALYGPALGIASAVPAARAPGRLTAGALADAADAVQATVVFASPAALRGIVAGPNPDDDRQRAALHRVRLLVSAGAPVPAALLHRLPAVLPAAAMHTPYGMTEALPVTDIALSEIDAAGLGNGVCVGRPLAGVGVRISPLDLDGAATGPPSDAADVTGEIWVSGPHLKDGYDRLWATEWHSRGEPGWHRTADVGHLDTAGRLWVEGRLAHVISTASGPVTPIGIEQRVQALAGVSAAAAVGVGPPGTQQVVVVVVPEQNGGRSVLASPGLAAEVRAAVGLPVAGQQSAAGQPTAGQPAAPAAAALRAAAQPPAGRPTPNQQTAQLPATQPAATPPAATPPSAGPPSATPPAATPPAAHPTSGSPTSGSPTSGSPTSGSATSGSATGGSATGGGRGAGDPGTAGGHPARLEGRPGPRGPLGGAGAGRPARRSAAVRVLVTGASGMLGAAVADALAARGDVVTTLQRHPSGRPHREVLGDVADPSVVAAAVAGQDAVVHLAAKVDITGRRADYARTNITGTRTVLAGCVAAGVGRLVHVSSPSVAHAGQALVGAGADPADPRRARGHYARSKAAAELVALDADPGPGPRPAVVVLRPHLVWGPGDTQLIGRIVARARSGRLFTIGSGAALMDTTYVTNAADALVAAVDRCDRLDREVLVVSNGEPRPVAELLASICAAAGVPPPRGSVPAPVAFAAGALLDAAWAGAPVLRRAGDPPLTRFLAAQLGTAHWFDQRRTREALDWTPRVTLDEGFAALGAH